MTNPSPSRSRFSVRSHAARDWPLLAAAATALLSFIMLFVPWVSGFVTLNAFGRNMQITGPALIIVMVLAVILLIYCALVVDRPRYAAFALIPAACLLTIYIIKIGDVSDLIDQSGPGGGLSVGVGLWLGFVFAVATVCFLALTPILDRVPSEGRGRAHTGPEAAGTSSGAAGFQSEEGTEEPRTPKYPWEPPKAPPSQSA
jgi:hypothetical protein